MVKALIVIDMIKGNMLNIYNSKEVIKNQTLLIEEFNKEKLPVIIVTGDNKSKRKNPVMINLWGDEFSNKPKLKELIPDIEKAKKSKLVKKLEYSAFFKTDLENYCKKKKIDEMYFCGVYSGCCIYFSAADAAMRRIQPYLVTDASTTEKKSWHRKNSEQFRTVLGPLIKTKELIRELNKDSKSFK